MTPVCVYQMGKQAASPIYGPRDRVKHSVSLSTHWKVMRLRILNTLLFSLKTMRFRKAGIVQKVFVVINNRFTSTLTCFFLDPSKVEIFQKHFTASF